MNSWAALVGLVADHWLNKFPALAQAYDAGLVLNDAVGERGSLWVSRR